MEVIISSIHASGKTIRQSHPNDKDITTDENGAYSTMFFQATNDFNSYLQLIHV